MPIRERIGAGVLVCWALSGATACDDDKEQAAKMAEVQRIADEKLKKSEAACTEKLKKQSEELKAEAAKAKSEAEQALGKAQESVEEQTKAAEEALKKARGAYKAEGFAELATLNKQVQELSIKNAKASAKVKTATGKLFKDIVKEQQQIGKDIGAFDTAELDKLAGTKGKLVQDLAKMKQTLAVLKMKLP